jgi:hypothetical protein
MSTSVNMPSDYSFDISVPQDYDYDINIGGGLQITTGSTVTVNPMEVTSKVVGDPNEPITTLLIGDPKKPVSTNSVFEMANLPRFTLDNIQDLLQPKMRFRLPNYNQICFKWFGVEIASICLGGESQVITEPYVPNAHERCEEPCCEPDTRPFPGRPGTISPNA